MGTQTISFKRTPPKSSSGHYLPEASDIPIMRGRKFNPIIEINHLTKALKYLSESNCSFWACEGPKRTKDMCTCKKCWAMREVASVRQTLINLKNKGECDAANRNNRV